MKAKYYILPIATASAMMLLSCGKSNNWHLDGEITGAGGKELVVESQTFLGWIPTDTVKIDDNGHFSISHEPKGYPEIYRLRFDGHTLYFPVDSIETIKLTADASNLENSLKLEGSSDGDMLVRAEQCVSEAVKRLGLQGAVSDSLLKRNLAEIILERPQSVVSYYIINRRINNTPLFNLTNPMDIKILGAVANAYEQYRSNDPRAARLKEAFINARAQAGMGAHQKVEATAIGFHDIELYDVNGKKRNLADVAASNRLVLLNFTAYDADFSPAFNVELNKVYSKYHPSGLEIYQVAIDGNDVQWREAARNIPWVAVRNAGADASRNLLVYNVSALPTTFIIANGELAERVDDITKLSGKLSKY